LGGIRAELSRGRGARKGVELSIEYALISSLIAVFVIAALSALGTKLSSEFAEVGTALK
jgi:hypothetical protein